MSNDDLSERDIDLGVIVIACKKYMNKYKIGVWELTSELAMRITHEPKK
jgi:hypothetical protein